MERKFILNSPTSKQYALDFISRIELNECLEVVIQKERKDKTVSQRNVFHKLCKVLGDKLGYTLEEMKTVIKVMVYGTEIKTILGFEVEIIRSSELSDRGEYGELIETILRVGAQEGYDLMKEIN